MLGISQSRLVELIQQQLGPRGRVGCAVGVPIGQRLLGRLQIIPYLRGRAFLIGRKRSFDPVESLLRFVDEISCLLFGFLTHGAVTDGQLTNGRSRRARTSCLLLWRRGLRSGRGSRLGRSTSARARRGGVLCRLGRGRLDLVLHLLGRRRGYRHALRRWLGQGRSQWLFGVFLP